MKHRLNICVISETPYNTVSELSDILDYRVILTPDQLRNLNMNMIVMGIPPIELLSEDPTYSSVIITVCTQKEFDEHIQRVSEQTSRDTDIYKDLNLIFNSVYVHEDEILSLRQGSYWNGHPKRFPSVDSFAKAIDVHWEYFSKHYTMLYQNTPIKGI